MTYSESPSAGNLVLDALVDGVAQVPQQLALLGLQQPGGSPRLEGHRPQRRRVHDWRLGGAHERRDVPDQRTLYAH